jgi:hypothetical protein
MEAHTDLDPAAPLIVDDAVATASVKGQEWLARHATDGVAEAPR